MSEVDKNNLKISKKIKILDNFSDNVGPWNYASDIPRGTGCIAPKLRGARLKGPKTRGAKVDGSKTLRGNIEGKFALQSFGSLNLCPAEFWTPQPVPRGVLEQCNLCPAEFWRHSFSAQNNCKNDLKIKFFFFFKGYFCKPLTFQKSIQPIRPVFREEIFCGTVPLSGQSGKASRWRVCYQRGLPRLVYGQPEILS